MWIWQQTFEWFERIGFFAYCLVSFIVFWALWIQYLWAGKFWICPFVSNWLWTLSLSIFKNLQVQMQLFYLLSGYCLTLKYGSMPNLSKTQFYWARMARILPINYVCHLAAIPSIFLGYNHFPPQDLSNILGGIASLLCIQSWIIIFGFGPNPPSWTISTLFFFYWTFPWILAWGQTISSPKLAQLGIPSLFYAQMVMGFAIFTFMPELGYFYEPKLWLATAHPLTRLPIFAMGVFAGILALRLQNGEIGHDSCKKHIPYF